MSRPGPIFAAVCPACGRGLRLRRRRRDGGRFIGCSGWPMCDFACDDIGSPKPPGPIAEVDAALRTLIVRWHPDCHVEALTPHEVVAELNAVRDLLRAEVAA